MYDYFKEKYGLENISQEFSLKSNICRSALNFIDC